MTNDARMIRLARKMINGRYHIRYYGKGYPCVFCGVVIKDDEPRYVAYQYNMAHIQCPETYLNQIAARYSAARALLVDSDHAVKEATE